MNIKYLTLTIFIMISSLAGQEKQTYFFKNGQRVTGSLIDKNDSTGVYTVQTNYGVITFTESELQFPEISVHLKSGEIFTGELMLESAGNYTIRTSLGIITIQQDQIEKMDFKDDMLAGQDGNTAGVLGRWYYGDERLIDIFFDPTAYLLEDNILYLSGLSWGYGLTKKIQITSRWAGYFFGDLNARAKVQIFKTGNIQSEKVGALGIHLHRRGNSNKFEYKTFIDERYIYDGTTIQDTYQSWEIIDSGDKPWVEFFGAVTSSRLKASGQGRINYTGGFSTTLIDGGVYNRFYGAVTSDARKNLKLVMEIIYDPYFPSVFELERNKDDGVDISLDFGFIYAYNEKFRIGIHYQRPFLAFYYKF
ncbi:MAG: hypothetical protein ACE5D8_09450 [Fidelibacterota bacterium]